MYYLLQRILRGWKAYETVLNKSLIKEVKAKKEFFGKTLQELDTIDTYRLTLITIIRNIEKKN